MLPKHEMPLDLFSFKWGVQEQGYEWVHIDPKLKKDKRFRSSFPCLQFIRGGEIKQYEPLKDSPQLFMKFAAIGYEPEGILEFANEYGPLYGFNEPIRGHRDYCDALGVDRSSESVLRFLGNQSISEWRENIYWMGTLLQIWEWLQDKSSGKLGQHFIWEKDRFKDEDPRFRIPGEFRVIFHQEIKSRRLPESYKGPFPAEEFPEWHRAHNAWVGTSDQFPPGSVTEAAMSFLAREVTEALSRLKINAVVLNKGGKFDSTFRPENLVGALWFQFFQMITGEKRIIRCEVCGDWMDVTDNRRSKKMHDRCSLNRRMKKYRAGGEA